MKTEPTPPGTGIFYMKEKLLATLVNSSRQQLAKMPFPRERKEGLIDGFTAGYNAAINALVSMGVIVLHDPPGEAGAK